MIVGFKYHPYIKQNPLSKYISLCIAVAAVVYCNPQSILVNFPMNIEVYSAQQSTVLYIIDTLDLLDMHALEPVTFWASGIQIREITHAYITTITYSCYSFDPLKHWARR